jgi:RNA-splicing ligase RtcB
MREIKGKYGTAIIYNDDVEQEAISQIYQLLEQPMSQDAHTRLMPDIHSGKGCVIGYTAKLTDKTVPNLVGVDVGCGVFAVKLGKRSKVHKDFQKLDDFIREYIPSGKTIREVSLLEDAEKIYSHIKNVDHFDVWKQQLKDVCTRSQQNYDYVTHSIGTLGGGNHFLEIDLDDDDNYWFIVHSGSRNFGKKLAEHWQKVAVASQKKKSDLYAKEKIALIRNTINPHDIESKIRGFKNEYEKIPKDLEYLEGENAEAYFQDSLVAMQYAQLNRYAMAYLVAQKFFKFDFGSLDKIESIHNYIGPDRYIRKGAISAYSGEQVIIPMTMAAGCVVGIGKGVEEWNFSAPHGAGRKMSRSKAKASIALEDFQYIMKKSKVWSSCVSKNTLDESPQAYKKPEDIIDYLKDTVDVTCWMKPVYNFKAGEEQEGWGK